MDSSFDGPSSTVSFNPSAAALLPVGEEGPSQGLLTLIRTAEAVGGTVGKIVHAARQLYAKLDMRHRVDMRTMRDAADELQAKGAAIKIGFSEISGNVKQYVRTHNAKDIGNDLERAAKRHPVQSLALATAVGFLLERALQKRRC